MNIDTTTELMAFAAWRKTWTQECESALYAALSADDRNAMMAWSAWQESARQSGRRMNRRADDVRVA